MEPSLNFSADPLKRQQLADRIAHLVDALAKTTALPAGRVIAVDAPWGSGKTWIAQRLPGYLESDKRIGRCIYVNAFQFDYHHDPFAVLVSAVLQGLRSDTPAIRGLRAAAFDVLKASLPAVGKGVVKAGARLVGVDADSIAEAIADSVEKSAEKALEKLLDTFEETTKSTAAFRERLASVANDANGSLVIVVDELDRCRPDFALELLERIKHLFDVVGLAFVLFVHTDALHSAIKQTYGRDVDAAMYLQKFISVTLPLPLSDQGEGDRRDRSNFYRRFLDSQYPDLQQLHGSDFVRALSSFAAVFDATFRDLQNVVLLANLFPQTIQNFSPEAAYLLLLRLKDPRTYALMSTDGNEASRSEVRRFGPHHHRDDTYVSQFRDVFGYHASPTSYLARLADVTTSPRPTPEGDCQEIFRYIQRARLELKVEHLKL